MLQANDLRVQVMPESLAAPGFGREFVPTLFGIDQLGQPLPVSLGISGNQPGHQRTLLLQRRPPCQVPPPYPILLREDTYIEKTTPLRENASYACGCGVTCNRQNPGC